MRGLAVFCPAGWRAGRAESRSSSHTLTLPFLSAAWIVLLGVTANGQTGATPPKPADPTHPAAPAKPVAAPKPRPGDGKVRPAIEAGLAWLCQHQDEDGGWHAKTIGSRCKPESKCVPATDADQRGDIFDAGITGLAVLALLGSGTTPAAPILVYGAGPDVDTWAAAQHGIAWLMSNQRKDGTFSGPGRMYNECIGAMALCEAYRINKSWDCRQAAQRAIEFIEEGQATRSTGKGLWGWRYTPRDAQSDTSVTGWAVRAFKAADRAGIRVPKAALIGAQDFVVWATGDKGLVGYMDPLQAGEKVTGHNDRFDYHPGTMSALGIQIRLRTDDKPSKANSEWIKTAVNAVLLEDLPSAKTPLGVDYYYWNQAMDAWSLIDAGGLKSVAQSGAAWRAALVEALTSLQSPVSEKCSSGGWLQEDRWAYAGGPIYTTAINVLTLEAAAGG
jgi:hypothetical protein